MPNEHESAHTGQALRGYAKGPRNARWIDLPIDEIIAMYESGMSEKAIAIHFGVSRTAITPRIIAAGIPRRGMAAARELAVSRIPMAIKRERIKAAQEATRGRRVPMDVRIKRAKTRQDRALGRSPAENILEHWLADRGIHTIPQQAIGPYNVDLGAFPVAVEIFGGGWHFSKDHTKRFRYLFDAGWSLIIVFVDGRRSILTEGAADYIVTFLQETASNPSSGCQYRVIWGEGKLYAAGGADPDQLSLVVPRRGRHGRGPRS